MDESVPTTRPLDFHGGGIGGQCKAVVPGALDDRCQEPATHYICVTSSTTGLAYDGEFHPADQYTRACGPHMEQAAAEGRLLSVSRLTSAVQA